ncbi:MAG: 5-formyltetrahydrofolate cyclo-ligase [Chlorobiaceae bacterium]|nr:5-formyltetrahydrofolate cyclo-ligase [Chlorobiaceae bacterium]NTW75027.1 5-formyltetrahydrofolate cyclo-ligase [Chlorobiaceae bacterium]
MDANEKRELRKELLLKRRAMDRSEWLRKSEAASGLLRGLDAVRQAGQVHCYVSMEAEREVSTLPLLDWLSAAGKAVFMPYIEQGRMRSARYLSGHCFRNSRPGPPVPDPLLFSGDGERFDAVIVPLVGVDRKGTRIGYGKGWYDRFFAALLAAGNRPVKIGLCFEFQIVPEVRPDPWDQHLDVVVTENCIINCMNGRS